MESGHQVPYLVMMLRVDVFNERNGAKTLLVWGVGTGMTALLAGLSAVRSAAHDEVLPS